MKIVCLQFERKDEAKNDALARMHDMIARAPEADLLLLPEIWASGFFRFDAYASEAESVDGPLVRSIAGLAAKMNTYIMMGSFIEQSGNELYNTSLLIDKSGTVVARYRKIHLFGYQSQERSLLTAGREIVVVETPWGTAGMATCYDLRFPEFYRLMLDKGARFFLVTSAWPLARVDAWNLFCRARAHENLAFLIACNCAGFDGGLQYAGNSQIVDPYGQVLVQGDQKGGMVTAEIDHGLVDQARTDFPALHDRVFV